MTKGDESMDNESEKLRVSYRFDKKTVDLLKKAQKSGNPMYQRRSMTWLLEYAVATLYEHTDNNGRQ